ncbi:MAG: hypothetical protein F6J95_010070 [Leptolyngbya sp. SIO1E4]|nr:hypothetical protein [Leptolyngbya sp. SIO1E4]
MLNNFLGKETAPPYREKNSQLNYLWLVLETGICLAALSSGTAWSQTAPTDDMADSESDQPPDQAMPDAAAFELVSVSPEASPPESRLQAEFSPSNTTPQNARSSVQQIALATDNKVSPKAEPVLRNQPAMVPSLPTLARNPDEASETVPIPQSSSVSEGPLEAPYDLESAQPQANVFVPAEPTAVDRGETLPTSPSLALASSTQARDLLLPGPEASMQPRFSAPAAGTASAASADEAETDASDGAIPADSGGVTPAAVATIDEAASPTSAQPAQLSEVAASSTTFVANRNGVEASASEDAATLSSDVSQFEINEYLTEPTPIEPGVLSPLITTIPFNGGALEFDARGDLTTGVSFGDDRDTNIRFRGTYTISRELESSTTVGNVTTLAQRQAVLQVQDVLQERELEISQQDPVTVLGQNIQISLTASCLESRDDICTYTPGIITDRDSIDPETLLPTRFEQTSNFGDVVTPESLAAIQEPGFQQGANGQLIGVDLYLPNIATLPGNSLSTSTDIDREERFDTIPAVSFAEISQTVQGNANEAALARTIRGPAIVFDTDQPITNVILAAAALLLPEAQPFVPDTEAASNPNINRGLFFAANNTRIPASSLTLYQTGVGRSATPLKPVEDLSELPDASFNAIWLGLSPVTDRSYETESTFELIGDQRVTLFAGGEGGRVASPEVISLVNGELFSSRSLDNVYTQNYVTLFEQDAFRADTFRQIDRIRYYPHLSFSGNITGSSDVLRYYAGTIAGENLQAYGGLDYQGQTSDGWFYEAGAIGFINPNYDRYSNLSAGVGKRINFGKGGDNLTLGTSANWALDQDTRLGDIEQIGQGSDITLRARLNLGSFSVGASQLIGDVLPNSQESRTVLDTAVKLGEDFTISGFWSPFDNATSSPRFGVLANVGLNLGDVNPDLVFSWQNTRYEYGEDATGRDLTTTGNAFEVLLRMDW